jgi:hypothetical protein
LLVLAHKEGNARHDFCEDTPNWPHVDWSWVVFGAQQDIRRSIPQSYDFMSKVLYWNSEGSCKTEIGKL